MTRRIYITGKSIIVRDNGHKTPDEIVDEIFNKIIEVEHGSV